MHVTTWAVHVKRKESTSKHTMFAWPPLQLVVSVWHGLGYHAASLYTVTGCGKSTHVRHAPKPSDVRLLQAEAQESEAWWRKLGSLFVKLCKFLRS